jgi:hypothetical protein
VTAFGWETIESCDDFHLLGRGARTLGHEQLKSGVIVRSSVPTSAQDEIVFQAAACEESSPAATRGGCAAADFGWSVVLTLTQ